MGFRGLAVSGLDFSYEPLKRRSIDVIHRILRGLSFLAPRGRVLIVAGPNGSGKSTLLKCMAGLLHPCMRGRITLDGENLLEASIPRRARLVTYVPHSLSSEFPLTVEEFVSQGLFVRDDLSLEQQKKNIASVMCQTNLSALGSMKWAHLSAGERQLTAVARALVQDPEILLLDELTANLDLHHQLLVMDLLKRWSRRDKVVVLVSHELNVPFEFADDIVLLKNGELMASGEISEVAQTDTMVRLYGTPHLFLGNHPRSHRPHLWIEGHSK